MRTGNPTLSEKTFEGFSWEYTQTMTLDGTVNKSYLLLWITVVSAIISWMYIQYTFPFYIPAFLVTLGLAIVISFKKEWAQYLAPIYAIFEWVFVSIISTYFEMQYPWIIIQAVSLTFWVFLMMLVAYQTKIIKPTENFKLWVFAATWAIAVIYLINLFWYVTGLYNLGSIHQVWGFLGIAISVVIVAIAALNLVLDFDFIETGVELKAPKYMEWYAAFGLLVTLVWLYIEILRLLSKARD